MYPTPSSGPTATAEGTTTQFTNTYEVDLDANRSREVFSIEWAYPITDIGSTTVEEPDWLDEA